MSKKTWEIIMQCSDNSERLRFRVSRHQFAEAASQAYLEKNKLKTREAKILSVKEVTQDV